MIRARCAIARRALHVSLCASLMCGVELCVTLHGPVSLIQAMDNGNGDPGIVLNMSNLLSYWLTMTGERK